MTYAVKEIFYTLQGEGTHAGRPAVFCRFSGCNLWSGKEQDRADAICNFCDTDFVGTDGVGGGSFEGSKDLTNAIERFWPSDDTTSGRKMVVFTGGEPLLQLDCPLIEELHKNGFLVAVETNGTILPPAGIDWITVSPKYGSTLKLRFGDELKLVYPQVGYSPSSFVALEFNRFFLQPMDGPNFEQNRDAALKYCLDNPRWELCLQTQKILGIR